MSRSLVLQHHRFREAERGVKTCVVLESAVDTAGVQGRGSTIDTGLARALSPPAAHFQPLTSRVQ